MYCLFKSIQIYVNTQIQINGALRPKVDVQLHFAVPQDTINITLKSSFSFFNDI